MKSYERNGELLLFADAPNIAEKLCLQPWATSLQRETFNMDAPGSQQSADAEGAGPGNKSGWSIRRERGRAGFATPTCAATAATSIAGPHSEANDTTATTNRENS